MKTLRVTTAHGASFLILNATAFGPDAVIGTTVSEPQLKRVFYFDESDTVEEVMTT